MNKVHKVLGARARSAALHAARAEARHRHRAATAARARAPQPEITPLESRIMMDAADLDLGIAAAFNAQFQNDAELAVHNLLSLAGELSREMGALGDELAAELGGTLGDAIDLFANPGDNPYLLDKSDPTADIFASLGSLGETFGDAMLADLTDDLADEMSGILSAIRTQLTEQAQTAIAGDIASLSDDGRDRVDALIADELGDLDFTDLLDTAGLFRTVLGNAAQLAQSLVPIVVPDPGVTPPEPGEPLLTSAEIETYAGSLGAQMLTVASGEIAGALGDSFAVPNFTLTLEDIVIGDKTIIDFSQVLQTPASGDDPAVYYTDRVDVEILIGNLLPDLSAIYDTLGIGADTLSNWADFSGFFDGLGLAFQIGAQTTATDAEIGSTGVYHQNVSVTLGKFTGLDGVPLSMGGTPASVANMIDGLGFSAGFVSAGITGIDFASLGLDFGDTALTLGFSTDGFELTATLLGADGEVADTAGDLFDVTVTEAGATEAVVYNAQAAYDFVAIDFRADIDWGLDLLGQLNLADGQLALLGTLAITGNAGGVAATTSLRAAIFAGDEEYDLADADLTSDELDLLEADLDALSNSAEGLLALDGTIFTDLLRSLSSSLDIVFASSLLDFDLPFLDFLDFSSLTQAYQQLSDRLLEPMGVDLSILGLSDGSAEAVANLLPITAIAVDYADGTVLDALAGETVTFTVSVVVDSSAVPPLSVTEQFSILVPTGGFADMKALGEAFKLALAAVSVEELEYTPAPIDDVAQQAVTPTLADMLFVNVVRGTLELRGSGIEGFAIVAAAATGAGNGNVMASFGLEARNNTASKDNPLVGQPLDALLEDDWFKLYQLNLSIERTVTGTDGSAVTDLYRTMALSPTGGAWTLEDLTAQLNALFGAADIEMEVTEGTGDNLVFTVTADDDVSYEIAIDGAHVSVASSLDAFQAFVNDALNSSGLIPGAELVLDIRSGELLLDLPEFSIGFKKAFEQSISGGLGELAQLELAATLEFLAGIDFGFDVGVDLFGLFAATDEQGLSDFVFLQDVALTATLGASATAISGSGKLGVVEIALAGNDNSFEIGGQLDVTLVGGNSVDGYSNRLTIGELLESANSTAGIAGMIGTLDLVGTVDNDGEDVFALLSLSGLDIEVAGVGGLGDVLPSFTASLTDVLAPTDWSYDFGDSPLTDLIYGLGKDDFIDTLYNALILVNQVLGGVSDDLGFLGEEIPVLGVSVIDAFNFAEEMAAKLQAFKSNPNEGLNEISGALASAFGLDSDDLILLWDEGTFYVSLSLGFLEGAGLSYDFSLNLEELLGSFAGDDAVLSAMLDVVSSLANVTGEGTLVLDANIGFDLTFGIELPGLADAPLDAVTAATALTALAGVSQVTFNSAQSGHQGRDMLISVERKDSATAQTVYADYKIELDGAETVGQALYKIHETLGEDSGVAIILHHVDGTTTLGADDFADGTLTGPAAGLEILNIAFADTEIEATDYTGANALFGANDNAADFEAVDGVITGNDLDDIDLDAAHSFRIVVNGAEPITVTVPANTEIPEGETEPVDRTPADFIDALNAALSATMVWRADIGLGLPVDLPLAKLLVASSEAGALTFTATNFAEAIGRDDIAFAITGLAQGSANVLVYDLGGSNLATALGFVPDDLGDPASGAFSVTGAALAAKGETGGTRAFIVTEAISVGGQELRGTGIALDFIAGVEEGLNMRLSLGPLSVDVVDGKALIWSGDADDPNAYIRFGINDAADNYLQTPPDGETAELDGRLYFSAIADLFAADAPISVGDLFSFDALARLDVELPLQASLGLLSPDTDKLSLNVNLFETTEAGLVGFLPALVMSGLNVREYVEYTIPEIDFDEFISNLNPYAIINDPLLLANGLDSILKMIDKTLRSVIDVMDLPVVGSTLSQALGFFDDMSRSLVQPLLEAASTPNADGTLPTSVDLLEGLVNDLIKDLFGIEQDVIRAWFNTDADNPYLVAELYIDAILFDAALDVGFDLGIPGISLSVGESSQLLFSVNASINLAFGLDKMGFFFLNDQDTPEILLSALVTTSEGFVASASLAAVGLALSANAIQRGEDTYYGVLIGGEIAVDLFGELGRDYAAPGETGTEWLDRYESMVRLNELSTSKAAGGAEGNRTVAISGEFFVSIDMAMKTSIVNPVDNTPINELPSAIADFVLDAAYVIGGELEMNTLEFRNVGLYAGDFLVENVLPVVSQIYEYVKPLAEIVQFLKTTAIGPMSLYDILHETVGRFYPAALFIFDAVDTLQGVMNYIGQLVENDGIIYFGSFSLLSASSATGVVDTTNSRAMGNLRPGSVSATSEFSLTGNAAISNTRPGIAFNFLIFDDVSNVLNLITGNLADVELFEVDLTLLDLTVDINIVSQIKAAVSFLPGEVIDVLFGGLSASFYFHAEAGLTVGYDLYGIAQFLNSSDPIDILDGMYFDSDRPLFAIEASFHARVGVNLFVIKAGLELAGNFAFQLDFNDPNQDGKLRFGEIAWVLTDGPGITSLIEGQYRWGLSLSVYFEINLLFTSFGDSWTVFDVGGGGRFGYDFLANPVYLNEDGGVTTLNIGARAGSAIGASPDDISDVISVNESGQIVVNGKALDLGDTQTLLIYAGEGDNIINLSGLDSSISFQIFTGSGNDTITVGNNSGIISTGDGDDVITYAAPPAITSAFAGFAMFSALYAPPLNPLSPTAPAAGSGTPAGVPSAVSGSTYGQVTANRAVPLTSDQELVIVMGEGNKRVEMADSTASMIVVGGGDLEITDDGRLVSFNDWLQSRFQGETPDADGMAEIRAKIDPVMTTYTPSWQTKGSSDSVYIETGTGSDIIFAGNGSDTIISHGGDNVVFGGGGDDFIDLSSGDGDNWVEGGAGADTILGGSGDDVLLGWGRFDLDTTDAEYRTALAAQLTGLSDTDASKAVSDFRALVEGTIRDDGGDWVEGGAGDDILSGNHGNDILQGGAGDDLVFGGLGSDVLSGGTVTIAVGGVTATSPLLNFTPTSSYTITSDQFDDGADRLVAVAGSNVMLGGAGNDVLEGGGLSSVLVGDFAELGFSPNGKLVLVRSIGIDSDLQGEDTLIGGALADVMVGGGGRDLVSGGHGNNILIGDNAEITGSDLYRGLTELNSLIGIEDDADTIYTGLTASIIIAGGSKNREAGDYIETGRLYGLTDGAAEGMIVFADYGDMRASGDFRPTLLTTVFDAGDDDVVNTTGGADIVFGGAGDDRISSGNGDDIVLGDTGTYRYSAARGEDRGGIIVTTDHDATGNTSFGTTDALAGSSSTILGADTISAGNGNNVVLGGGGADEISTGTGFDVILGDLGSVTLYARALEGAADILVESVTPVTGGEAWIDTVISGGGGDIVVGGDGADIIRHTAGGLDGLGQFAVLGDFGTLSAFIADSHSRVTGATENNGGFTLRAMASTSNDTGGDDTIYGGAGREFIIGGAGADTIALGDGDKIVLGDAGEIDNVGTDGIGSAHSIDFTLGGDDAIETGDGQSIIIAGIGADTVTSGDGDDLIIGDNGLVTFTALAAVNERRSAEGLATDLGGDDEIASGDGADVVMGGQGADLIDLGAGNDLGIGDWALIDFDAMSLTTQAPEHGGTDRIGGGDGNDVVIGGHGADVIAGNGGSNVVLGDYAGLTWADVGGERFALETITLEAIAHWGNDTLYTNYGLGDDAGLGSGTDADANSIAIGQRGDDVIHGGLADDFVLADWGVFVLLDPATRPGWSAFDRISSVESTEYQVGGNDVIETYAGRDVVIAGDGDDYIDGGDGQDLIHGDDAIYANYHDGWELLESRFPFQGGDDVIRGGAGNDIIVSGYFNFGQPGAGDLLYGDTIEDWLMGDEGSVLIFENLVRKFNYLGIAPADLISTNQLGASAGVLMRPVYDRGFPDEGYFDPWAGRDDDTLGELRFVPPTDEAIVADPDLGRLDAILRAEILSPDMLRLIELYRRGVIGFDDLEMELREAILMALFDTYGYRLPASVEIMLDRYMELLAEHLDLEQTPGRADAAAPDRARGGEDVAAALAMTGRPAAS